MTTIGPQVAFVDDVKTQITPLKKLLDGKHAGTVFFDARPDHTTYPSEPLETVKLLFLDLFYNSSNFDPSLPAQWVEKIIAPNTKYTLVIWSNDTHEKDRLLNLLADINLTPTRVESWQKTDKEYQPDKLPEVVDRLLGRIEREESITAEILSGEVIDISTDGVSINCRLNEDQPTFQVRRFDRELLANVSDLKPGTFVRICIYSKPGARLIDIFEENRDLSAEFEQPDFFKDLEGNAFFIQG